MAEPRQYPMLVDILEADGVCIPPQTPLPFFQQILIRNLLRNLCRYLKFHA